MLTAWEMRSTFPCSSKSSRAFLVGVVFLLERSRIADGGGDVNPGLEAASGVVLTSDEGCELSVDGDAALRVSSEFL